MSSDALIFTHTITPRIKYIANFLSNFYKTGFGVTSSVERFRSSEVKCKINYSQQKISNSEIWIHPHVLLFESSVRQVKIDVFPFKQHVAFLKRVVIIVSIYLQPSFILFPDMKNICRIKRTCMVDMLMKIHWLTKKTF